MSLSLLTVPNAYDVFCNELTVNTLNAPVITTPEINTDNIVTAQLSNKAGGDLFISSNQNILIATVSPNSTNLTGIVRVNTPGLAIIDSITSNQSYTMELNTDNVGPADIIFTSQNSGTGEAHIAFNAKTAITLNAPYLAFFGNSIS